jgi:hypothetical protein
MSSLNNHIFLQGAKTFAQYRINGNVLTVIGENHLMDQPKCDKSSIVDVSDLISQSAKLNPNATILLEFEINKPKACLLIQSINIQNTFKSMIKYNLQDQLKGFDFRRTLLLQKDQNELYKHYADNGLKNLSANVIENVFVNSILYSLENNLQIDKNVAKADTENLEKIRMDIKNHSEYINKELKSWDSNTNIREEILKSLKHLWKKVADFYTLMQISIYSQKGDVIILAGDQHAINLNTVFQHDFFKLTPIRGSKDNCIDLYKSYNI